MVGPTCTERLERLDPKAGRAYSPKRPAAYPACAGSVRANRETDERFFEDMRAQWLFATVEIVLEPTDRALLLRPAYRGAFR